MHVYGYSLEAQRERLNKFADYQGMEVVREYCDAGCSGKNISGRPEFTQMLKNVANERDGVDYILVFKLSKFGRNVADVLNSLQYAIRSAHNPCSRALLEACDRYGIYVVDETWDTQTSRR
jgi:site-specific DNA recombinase